MNRHDASTAAWTVLDNAKTRFEPIVGGASGEDFEESRAADRLFG